MKSNVPWSVKGIDPEARNVAKEAARKRGMTLGEWMNEMIREQGLDREDAGGNDSEAPASPVAGVTVEQLRAVVDSLNRLNDRLKTTEDGLKQSEARSLRVAGDLGHGLETVFERMKRLERERIEGTPDKLAERVDALERGEGDKGRIEGLGRLEGALTAMVEALEATRAEAIDKIAENEANLAQLASRVDLLDDRLTSGFAEVHGAIDAVGEHLDRTERTAQAVLRDAEAAAGSSNAEFVEQTSKRLQILGGEIKRSGDQIRHVEEMVSRLSTKIEAAEQRSAEGIGEVAGTLDALRAELAGRAAEPASPDDQPEAETRSLADEDGLAEAAAEADRKVSRLQRSYEAMMARLEGRPEPESEPDEAPAEAVRAAPEADEAGEPEALAPAPSPAPEDEVGEPLTVDVFASDLPPGDEEFDAVFGDTLAAQPDLAPSPAAPLAASAPSLSVPAEEPLPGGEAVAPGRGRPDLASLTPRQKVLLAAKARKKRLEAEREADEVPTALAADPFAAPDAAPSPALSGADAGAEMTDEVEASRRRLSLPRWPLMMAGLFVAVVLGAGYMLFGGESEPQVAATAAPRTETPAPRTADAGRLGGERPAPAAASPAPTTARADGQLLYEQALTLQDSGQEAEALRLLQEGADANYVPAWFRLGHAYYNGLGTEKDDARARSYFLDAALSGNALAMHYLGTMSINDEAHGQNVAAALDWYERAASYGMVDSMYNLGYLFDPTATQNPMPASERDPARAYYWYALAASQGDEPARLDARDMAANLPPETIAEVDAQIAAWSPLPLNASVNDGLSLPG